VVADESEGYAAAERSSVASGLKITARVRPLLAAAGVLAVAGCRGEHQQPGPLGEPPNTGSTRISGDVQPGQVGLASFALPVYQGGPAPVLVRIRPTLHDSRAFEVRFAISTRRGMHFGFKRGWRPRTLDLEPVRGFVVPPLTVVAVVVGMSADRPGAYSVPGFAIDYRVGTKHYRASYADDFEICVGRRSIGTAAARDRSGADR
jgi:hypothetical protein